jgi:hypothetical protein
VNNKNGKTRVAEKIMPAALLVEKFTRAVTIFDYKRQKSGITRIFVKTLIAVYR